MSVCNSVLQAHGVRGGLTSRVEADVTVMEKQNNRDSANPCGGIIPGTTTG